MIGLMVGLMAAPAVGRERVLVLPFRATDPWSRSAALKLGTAFSLQERLSRTGAVTAVPLRPLLAEVLASGVTLGEVSRADTAAARSLGRWAGADLVVVGMMGDRDGQAHLASFSVQADAPPTDGLWLAALAIDVSTGRLTAAAVLWGRRAELVALHGRLLKRLAEGLAVPPAGLVRDAVLRLPTRSVRAYRCVSEAAARYVDLQSGRPPEATRTALQAGIDLLVRAQKEDDGYAEAWAWLGDYRLLEGDREAAASAYRSAVDLDPDYLAPRYGLAGIAEADGLPAAVEDILAGIVRVAPWDDGAWAQLGARFLRRGAVSLGREALLRAADLDTDRPEVYMELGLMARDSGRQGRAVTYLSRAADLAPAGNPYQDLLASALLAAGRPAEALEAADTAARRAERGRADGRGKVTDVRGAIGRASAGEPHRTTLWSELDTALAGDSTNTVAWVQLGNAFLEQGDRRRAEAAYASALRQDSASASAAIGLGNVAFAGDDLAAAEAWYRRAIRAAPTQAIDYTNLAAVYASQGRLERADIVCRRALKLAPEDPAVHVNLAVIAYRAGDLPTARGYCELALGLDPAFPAARDLIARIPEGRSAGGPWQR